jgi:hypothetical protein
LSSSSSSSSSSSPSRFEILVGELRLSVSVPAEQAQAIEEEGEEGQTREEVQGPEAQEESSR